MKRAFSHVLALTVSWVAVVAGAHPPLNARVSFAGLQEATLANANSTAAGGNSTSLDQSRQQVVQGLNSLGAALNEVKNASLASNNSVASATSDQILSQLVLAVGGVELIANNLNLGLPPDTAAPGAEPQEQVARALVAMNKTVGQMESSTMNTSKPLSDAIAKARTALNEAITGSQGVVAAEGKSLGDLAGGSTSSNSTSTSTATASSAAPAAKTTSKSDTFSTVTIKSSSGPTSAPDSATSAISTSSSGDSTTKAKVTATESSLTTSTKTLKDTTSTSSAATASISLFQKVTDINPLDPKPDKPVKRDGLHEGRPRWGSRRGGRAHL